MVQRFSIVYVRINRVSSTYWRCVTNNPKLSTLKLVNISKHATYHQNQFSSVNILENSSSLIHKLCQSPLWKMRQSCLDFLASSTTSLIATTMSEKLDCWTRWFSFIETNLKANTLTNNLYMKYRREIRWNSPRDWGESTWGIKATK